MLGIVYLVLVVWRRILHLTFKVGERLNLLFWIKIMLKVIYEVLCLIFLVVDLPIYLQMIKLMRWKKNCLGEVVFREIIFLVML